MRNIQEYILFYYLKYYLNYYIERNVMINRGTSLVICSNVCQMIFALDHSVDNVTRRRCFQTSITNMYNRINCRNCSLNIFSARCLGIVDVAPERGTIAIRSSWPGQQYLMRRQGNVTDYELAPWPTRSGVLGYERGFGKG